MWIWISVIAGFLLLLLLYIYFLKISIKFTYSHEYKEDVLSFEIRAVGGIFKFRRKIPILNSSEEPDLNKREEKDGPRPDTSKAGRDLTIDQVMNHYAIVKERMKNEKVLKALLNKWMERLEITDLKTDMIIGTGEAASTAILNGFIWSVTGNVLAIISRYVKLSKIPKITITPAFHTKIANLNLSGIIRFRLGETILAGRQFLRYWHMPKDEKKKEQSHHQVKTEENHKV